MSRTVLIGLVLATTLLLAAAGLGAAAAIYDQRAHVPAACDERFGDNSPAGWTVRGIDSARPGFDGAPYFVADYREERIRSRDPGIELHAWWLPPRDGADAPSIIVVHGFGTCVRDPAVLAPAGMLHRLGYGVLLLDLRDHGDSTIEDGRAAGGTEEYRDVLGAVDWLVSEGAEPGRVGLLGTSMGAAAAIIAAEQDPRIPAVWAESSYADVVDLIADGLEAHGVPGVLAPIATVVAQVVAGDDITSPSMLGGMQDLRGRRLSIVHGSLDGLVDPAHARVLGDAARAAGVEVEVWLVADAGHVDAVLVHPDEYERRLGRFFGAAFGR